MAGKDFTTKGQQEQFTLQEVQKLMSNLRVIRATADLLCAAGGTIKQARYEFHTDTLEEIGEFLEDLATEGLVILRYENPKEEPASPAAPAGGVV